MRDWTLAAVAEAVGAELAAELGDRRVGPDVVIDSRLATPGSLFVALPGERVDGHDFAGAAAAGGAVAALCSRPVAADLTSLVVADPQRALADLARAVIAQERARGLRTIALTGSSGKTSTKDILAQVLARAGATVSPPGSFNNEIGVPLTALHVDADTRYLVSEMGARGLGHVAWLCSVVPPDIAAVLNVGHAHVGEFGSVAAIAAAKGEIIEGLDETGWAVLNADDPLVAAMAPRTAARIACFSGSGRPAAGELRVWADDAVPDELQRYGFTLHAEGPAGGSALVQLRVSGRHQVHNAAAAAAVALAAGLGLDEVAAGLSSAVPLSRWRMELQPRPDGVLIVNDAYNANPDSMAAALATVAGLRRPGGRLIAVLGDMLELGADGPEAHRALGRAAAEGGFEVIGVGELGAEIAAAAAAAGGRAAAAAGADEALRLARTGLTAGDVVLVKASRGLALDRVALRLMDPDDHQGAAT